MTTMQIEVILLLSRMWQAKKAKHVKIDFQSIAKSVYDHKTVNL